MVAHNRASGRAYPNDRLLSVPYAAESPNGPRGAHLDYGWWLRDTERRGAGGRNRGLDQPRLATTGPEFTIVPIRRAGIQGVVPPGRIAPTGFTMLRHCALVHPAHRVGYWLLYRVPESRCSRTIAASASR